MILLLRGVKHLTFEGQGVSNFVVKSGEPFDF